MEKVRCLAVPFWTVVVWLLATTPSFAVETHKNQAFATALNSVTAAELGHHVDVLADDSFEGREAGSRGGKAAGGYLVQAMEQDGIRPAGEDGGYFQYFGSGYRNVLGMIEGRDPKLKHEFVVIGAHYDHVGYGTSRNSFGPTGYIHNGADDNASGTSGVLEILQAFAMLPQPPRRSILFAFWDGEEKGLLGSKHFVEYPTIPLKNVVMVFNSDMIGRLRNEHLEVYGARTARGLRQLVSQENSAYGMQLDFIWDVKPNSDHYSFFKNGVPFLMFHTGLHDNYHRPSDDAELINRDGMLEVSQLMFRVAYEVSETEHVAPFRKQARFESNRTRAQFERTAMPPPARLGVSWSREDGNPGLLVTRVTPGSAAAQAGVTVGDRILEFAGRTVESGDQFRLLVLAAQAPTRLVLQRADAVEPIEMSLNLLGKPVRIGISWDEDRAEPAMVILTRVIPGSAADQAGLAVGDRIYVVNGQRFADGDEFGNLVTHQAGPLHLQAERQGVLHDVTIRPVETPQAETADVESETTDVEPATH